MTGFAKALRCWPWLAALCTGLLCGACFAPFNQAWLCWIALTPLLAAVWFSGEKSKRRWLRDLLLGYVAGLVFFWIVFSWLHTVTVPGAVLVGLYMGFYFAGWSWFCGMLRPTLRKVVEKQPTGLDAVTQRLAQESTVAAALSRRASTERGGYSAESYSAGGHGLPNESSPLRSSPWLSSTNNLRLAFLLASAWVTHEALRGIVFSGWSWNSLGSALHAQWPLIQIAEFTGVPGLSFLVAFTNVILISSARRFILETQVRPMRAHFDLTLTMAAIVGVMGFGVHALQVHRTSKPLRVALVQANIPREHKFNAEYAQTIFDQFSRLSRPAVETNSPVDLVVWPESSMPGPVLEDEASYRFVMNFSASSKTDLLLGTIEEEEKDAYNAALLVSRGGEKVQIYRKLHLVPFGEYVPGRHWIPFISQVVGNQVPDDFAFGKEHTVFDLTSEGVRAAPLICFEDTIGELTRQFVLGGANLLVNVTNDGWFQRSAGSKQHIANAVFRCVETRLPMVRAANTGVTCFINEFGRITHTLLDENGSQYTEGVLTGEVAIPTGHEQTFYVRHGELFEHCCVVVTLLAFAFYSLRLVRRKRAKLSS